uniref:Peptidase S74 domain-containing protein n=1 Tax=viral metagenome TaxID=1070528 RepID=A0A6C0CF53_9ZZZZ
MSIFIGSHDNNIYQNWQTTNNLFLNNTTSSNLLYLNYYDNTYQDASIIFKNNYQFGLLNNSITIFNTSNLFTANTTDIDIYTNLNLHSNLNVDNYIKTSNATVYLQSNLELNFNSNINNSFKIKFTNNQDIFNVYKDKINIYSSNIYASNIYIDSNSTLYTNFIDSPNNHPVVIRNMSFAEDLRILTNTVVEGINIDNTVVFGNLIENLPFNNNPFSNNTNFYGAWSNFMINNNIDIGDINFTQPNIIVKKIFHQSQNGNIGGSNIVDFYTINSDYTSNKIFTINNNGCINIGSNDNINIPLYIKVNPLNSNIFEYKNSSNYYNNISIGSNGFLNIGSNYLSSNQLNIVKNNYYDSNNKELITLNNYYNNATGIYNITNTIAIPFINDDFITDFKIYLDNSSSTVSAYTITNNFIDSNIATTLNTTIYTDPTLYNSSNFSSSNVIIYPINTFNITSTASVLTPLNIITYIYPLSYSSAPPINNNNYNIIPIYNSVNNTTNNFYIYKAVYNYSYTGKYKYNPTNLITGKYNSNNTVFSVSAKGNVGIGTKYTDLYNLYVASNAKIQNLDCATLSNYLTCNITFSNNTLNNINIINTNIVNTNSINTGSFSSTSNFMSYLNSISADINTTLNISSNAKLNTYCQSSFGIQNNFFNNYLVNVNISSNSTITNKNNGIVIYNNSQGFNPNLLLISTATSSYPSISLSNLSTNANILINSNLQILNDGKSVLINNNQNQYLSLYDNSIVVFNDSHSNAKIYLGQPNGFSPDWISSIQSIANNVSHHTINSYGILNIRSYDNTPLITTNVDNLNTVCIGIGIDMPVPTSGNYTCNLILINYETTFTSNVNINSNLYISGSILTPSDSNLKRNINKIQNSIEKINNISGYTYERIDTGNIESGLLAQEVINILPEVVEFNKNTNHYNISYGNMAGLFVESIKTLNDKINILTERISFLEKNK